jgi:hypothetical protein
MKSRCRLGGVGYALLLTIAAWSPAEAQWNREAEEDKVYRAVLAQMFEGADRFALVDSVPSARQEEPIRDKRGAPIPPPDSVLAQLAADYRDINRSRRSLRSLERSDAFVFVSDSVLDGASNVTARRVGMGPSLMRMSRVGFSADRRTAMVYVDSDCGMRCGHWGVMILVKEGEVWRFDRFLWALIA